MSDRLDRLERAVESLARTVDDLGVRLTALEDGSRVRRGGGPSPPVEPAEPLPAESSEPPARADRSRAPVIATRLPQVGRTLLVLGGAFLLRALTEAGILQPGAGVTLGLVYALTWIGLARRDAQRQHVVSASFHGLASVLVAYPLLYEGAMRFEVFSPAGVGVAWASVTVIGLGVAWSRHLSSVAWWFTLAATATVAVLHVTSGHPVLFAGLLLALGLVTLVLGYTRDWNGQRWLVAIPANLAVLRTAFLAPDGAATASVPGSRTLVVAFLLSYLGSFAVVTLFRRRAVGAFEIAQSAAVLLIGLSGAVHITHSAGAGGEIVGISVLTAGVLSYATAFAFVRKKLGRGRNFFFYSSLGLALVITGSRLLGHDGFCTLTWGLLAAAAALVGGRFDRVTLRAHSAVYAVAAALQSGLITVTASELVGSALTAPRGARWAWPALAFVSLAYATLVATRSFRRAPRLARVPRFVLALVSLFGITALAVFLVVEAVPEGIAGDSGFVAALRSAVLAVAAVALAFARRRAGLLELGWLAALLLGVGALKLLLEDLRAGGATALFVAFAFYGTALIVVPRLLRSPRAET